jgi:hypothetical protein
MRRLIHVATIAATLAGAATLFVGRAEAVPMPAAPGAAVSAEPVYATCTRYWNGWRWVRRCVEAVPEYGYGYYGPAYGYYGYGYGPGYWGWRRHWW